MKREKIPNKKAMNFIKEAADAGFSRDDIKVSLVNLNYKADDIKTALAEADRLAHTAPQQGPAVPHVPKIQAQPETLRPPVLHRPAAAESVKKKNTARMSRTLWIALAILWLAAASVLAVWAYDRFVLVTTDFDQLLPDDTQWYIAINTDLESDQLIKLNANIDKFPMAQELRDWAAGLWDDVILEELRISGLDKYLSLIGDTDEIAVAQLSALDSQQSIYEFDLEDISLVFMAKGIDEAKQAAFNEYLLSDSDISVGVAEYQGHKIYDIEVLEEELSDLPPVRMYFAFIEKIAVLTNNRDELKNIVDVAKSNSVMSLFGSKKQSLAKNQYFKKIKENMAQEYLAAAYAANLDLDRELDSAASGQLQSQISKLLKKAAPQASIIPQSLSVGGSNIDLIKDVVSGQVIRAAANSLQIDSYLIDLKSGQRETNSFSLSASLAQLLPEKINQRWVDFYAEGRNLQDAVVMVKQALSQIDQELKDQWQQTNDGSQANVIEEEMMFFEEFFDQVYVLTDQYFNLTLEDDLLPYAKGNFCLFAAPAFDGQGSEIGMIIQVEQADQVITNLKKMRLNDSAIFEMLEQLGLLMFLSQEDIIW